VILVDLERFGICDGRNPCVSCSESDYECGYGITGETNQRGKSDLILEGILRVEKSLCEMNAVIASPRNILSHRITLPSIDSSHETVSAVTDQSYQKSPQSFTSTLQNLQNAILDSMHTSATESVFQWSCFDAFPSLRQMYVSIFHLEQSRPPIKIRESTMYPYICDTEMDQIITSFEQTINFWYPTMSRAKLKAARSVLSAGDMDDSTTSCIASLIMALGCAGQVTVGLATENNLTDGEINYRASRRAMADMCMDRVLKKLHLAHMEMSTTATQCLFFVALYFAFLRRPIQAWEYINFAATKCRTLLSYAPLHETSEDQECIRRIFWSCYILESDYLAELSFLPQNGIGAMESSIPLPGNYNNDSTIQEEEKSTLYFLACISMRRLLNRVHHVLYARESGVSLDNVRFPSVVLELDHQLEEWRACLPAAFNFSVDTNETATEQGGFLRQRYLTCRSVIYRPYLSWVLTNYTNTLAISENVLHRCRSCLDACLLHILNLRGFAHTILVDTWICSMSMTGAMLILLAAYRLPVLRQLIGDEVLGAGADLQQRIQSWTEVMGPPSSPSVDQSLRMICEIDSLIQQEYEGKRGF